MKFADEAGGTISTNPPTNTRVARDDGNRFERRAVGVGNFVVSNGNRVIGAIEGVRKENFVFLNRNRRFERLGQCVRIPARRRAGSENA